jgi:hypothetical protein
MIQELTQKAVTWAVEIGTRAARLPSATAREAFFDDLRRQLIDGARRQGATADEAAILADACIDGARRISFELLARDLPHSSGSA